MFVPLLELVFLGRHCSDRDRESRQYSIRVQSPLAKCLDFAAANRTAWSTGWSGLKTQPGSSRENQLPPAGWREIRSLPRPRAPGFPFFGPFFGPRFDPTFGRGLATRSAAG